MSAADVRDTVKALVETDFGGQATVGDSRDSHGGAASAEEALGEMRAALRSR